MLEQKPLSELNTGDPVNHYLILNKFEVKVTKTNKEYLNLELRDSSSLLPAKMWNNIENFKSVGKEGLVVKAAGIMDEFNNLPQIKVEKIRLATDADNINPEDFLPKSQRNLEEMKSEFSQRMDAVGNVYLKQLLKSIFSEKSFENFIRVPAGKAWHHAYIHGLLEHTLEIMKICDLMCDIHPEINRDLLITGAMLHDFGKTEELKYDTTFDYTDKGKLIGHIVIAANLINDKTKEINNFPEDLKNQLIHIVLSHQGKLEFASPVEPKTLEAIALYHADELSAKTNAYKNAIKSDEGGNSNWTRFLRLANTSLYIPSDDESKEQKNLFDK